MALLLPVLAISAKLGCVNEAGEAVDWWFLYKHPRWTDASHKTCIGDCTGSTYVYSTSASPTSWTVGAHTVFQTSSLFGLQLAGVYDGSVTNYVFYNDQLPDGGGSSSSHGHSKGFFAFDETSAFFVQHSVPDFPEYVKAGYQYGDGQTYYGQHAFCMSLTPKMLNEIALVMQYAYPQVYDKRLDITSWPNINAVAAEQKLPGTTVTTIDVGWATLHLQGKASAAEIDMLDLITAPALKTDLWSQSWLNTGGVIGGYCVPPGEGYNVTDILTIQLPGEEPPDVHATQVDHSKWAVAKTESDDWFCALDNNHVDPGQTCCSGSGESYTSEGSCKQYGAVHGCVWENGVCDIPKPLPPPPPKPGPTPGNCCYHADATCSPGQTCCSGSGESYTSEGSCKQYGAVHGCVWENGVCDIPKSLPRGGPTPGNCCYHADATCSPGQTCCSGSNESYTSEGSCKQYGAVHGCVWENGVCDIPKSLPGIRALAQANCIQMGGECCAAPGGDVHKCPVRTSDCEPIASCCCD
ncbi:hypothetical protein Ctob_015141 [Chrysochromulina tobinii]|uniref:Uncharacterized protein n=1 Tax=Chrysochromulina tobinii TaxID=1460289 RepID=A0A0M0JZ46_9EUKA|nr:hypothetical protein Ctob_015141 [Chrysochromulina tobinii]|eukprot:KOO31921.1 hypothetical protein Ctob_015141 [Chrysochromulina sp. CCMP291]